MSTLKIPVTESDHIQGEPNAEVVLVEYGDYECPHCGMAYPVVKRLQEHFGKRLAFVFRNFPLNEIHANAEMAAETAEFAGTHRRFWEMHDGIFENQEVIGPQLFLNLAESLKLSVEGLSKALETQQFKSRVKSDFIGGVRSGVNGTPSFFINGSKYEGAYEFEELAEAITAVLAQE